MESLKDTQEIDKEIYAEILQVQKNGYLERVTAAEALANSMKTKLGQIGGQVSSLTRYLVNAKLGYKSGELDAFSLKLAQESIEPSLRPLLAEKNDITSCLTSLEKVLPARVSIN